MLTGPKMKAASVNVKDRRCVLVTRANGCRLADMCPHRYILWAMNKYRLGLAPKDFKHEPKPKKKVRGCVYTKCHALNYIELTIVILASDGALQYKMGSAFAREGSNRLANMLIVFSVLFFAFTRTNNKILCCLVYL
jgi:hypothetical protein